MRQGATATRHCRLQPTALPKFQDVGDRPSGDAACGGVRQLHDLRSASAISATHRQIPEPNLIHLAVHPHAHASRRAPTRADRGCGWRRASHPHACLGRGVPGPPARAPV